MSNQTNDDRWWRAAIAATVDTHRRSAFMWRWRRGPSKREKADDNRPARTRDYECIGSTRWHASVAASNSSIYIYIYSVDYIGGTTTAAANGAGLRRSRAYCGATKWNVDRHAALRRYPIISLIDVGNPRKFDRFNGCRLKRRLYTANAKSKNIL